MSVSAAFAVIFCPSADTVLCVLPTKNLPRRAGMIRELQEETSLVFADMTCSQHAQIDVPDLKAMIYMYTVEEELPVTAGNEISKVKWMPADTLLDCGTFVIQRAMFVTAGEFWSVDDGKLTLRDMKSDEPSAKKAKVEDPTEDRWWELHGQEAVESADQRMAGKPCPFCKTTYVPKYSTIEDAKTHEPGSIFVEQHISGVCSDKCWDDVLIPGSC